MTVFALVDCNNFYVSCERVFNPALNNKPVIVLSNNDGCTVARSNESEALGIKMGSPVFKDADKIKAHKIQVYSSNYALYGDMSQRVVSILSEFSPDFEVYSIDEAFLEFTRHTKINLTELGHTIRNTVKQHTGLPVSVGFASTKTLSKVAVKIAKTSLKAKGVLDLTDQKYHNIALERTPVGDVWGVGNRYARFLKVYGITNAIQLRDADPKAIRRKMGINGLRLIEELNGNCCYPLDKNPATKKGITVSRSFAKEISQLREVSQAAAAYATRCAEKLRNAGLVTNVITVFLMTNRFRPSPFYYNTHTIRLQSPTSDTSELISAALSGLRKIYREGDFYKKAGVMLTELQTADMVQQVMWDSIDREKSKCLMSELDRVNRVMGQDTIKYASSGLNSKPAWKTLFSKKSPCYTSRWSELLYVR